MASVRPIRKIVLAVLISLATARAASQTVGQCEVFEFSLTARIAHANPYGDGLPVSGQSLVHVTFSGLGGEAKGRRYAVAGFWDGGQT